MTHKWKQTGRLRRGVVCIQCPAVNMTATKEKAQTGRASRFMPAVT